MYYTVSSPNYAETLFLPNMNIQNLCNTVSGYQQIMFEHRFFLNMSVQTLLYTVSCHQQTMLKLFSCLMRLFDITNKPCFHLFLPNVSVSLYKIINKLQSPYNTVLGHQHNTPELCFRALFFPV